MNSDAETSRMRRTKMSDATKQGLQPKEGAVRPPGSIAGPFQEIHLAGEIERLWQEPLWQGGRNSKTLVKHADLRIVLTALKANHYLHEHEAAGSISVHTLAGHIRLHVPGRTFDLPAGCMVALEQELRHDVESLQDSTYLLTIAWRENKFERPKI